MAGSSALKRISDICLSFPGTKLTMPWGAPHFRVGEKIFCGYSEKAGERAITFKLEMEHADILVSSDRRFTRAPYVGVKGWVSLDANAITDWDEVRALVRESYRLIAPKKILAKLDAAPGPVRKPSRKKTR